MCFLGAYVYDIKEDELILTSKTRKFKHIVNESQNVQQQSNSSINSGIQTIGRGRRQRNNTPDQNIEFDYSVN